MLDAGIFQHIIAEVAPDSKNMFGRLIKREQLHHVGPSAIRRLVALLPNDTDRASQIAKSLKLSKKQQRALGQRFSAGINGNSEDQTASLTDIRAFAYRTSVDTARDAALLFADDSALPEMLGQLEGWQPPVFPLTGGDLIEKGLKPGPIVAKSLAKIEAVWIANGFPDEQWVRGFLEDQDVTLLT
jgi:poly(A) polymerase